MGKAPAFQFYVKDWLSDPELQCVSASTKGIWIDALCYMWEAPERGRLTGTIEELGKLLRATNGDFSKFLEDLKHHKFAEVTFDDKELTLINRRMFREQKGKENHILRQKRYKERQKIDTELTPPSSSSSPSPIPNLINISQNFEKFWQAYPSRNGKKVTKKESLQFFKDHFKTEEEINLLLKATANYANSCNEGFAKDPIRFLKKDFWKDWVESAKPKDDPYSHLPRIGGPDGPKN
jgi:hypothetical protein